jgi:uncharacterized protein YbjQ (UPF0145 family)
MAAKGKPQVLKVFSLSEEDEEDMGVLLGEYTERGTNHGRKTYQKANSGEENHVEVFLYYWDNRDGPDFCGWWFGNKVGGSQVWSRANAHGTSPPREGWAIPWDGPVVEDLLLVEPVVEAPISSKPVKKEPVAAQKPQKAYAKGGPERALAATERVAALEAQATEVLQATGDCMCGEVSEDTVKHLEKSLVEQQTATTAETKAVAKDVNDAKSKNEEPKAVAKISRLTARLRAVQQALSIELSKLKAQGQLEQQTQVAESRKAEMSARAANFESSLPGTRDIVSQVEDSVETVLTMAAPLSIGNEEEIDADTQRSMTDVEVAANKAHNALSDALKHVAGEVSAARKYAAESRKSAMNELTSLQTRLTTAQKKLAPYRRFKQDREHKVSAKKTIEEITDILGVAEVETEKAHNVSVGSYSGSTQMILDEIKAAEEVLTPAKTSFDKAHQMITSTKSRVKDDGALVAELDKLQARELQSREKMGEVKAFLQKQREGLKMQDMLMQVNDKVAKVEDSLEKTAVAVLPFSKGLDNLAAPVAKQVIKDAEAAVTTCAGLLGQARSLVKTRQSEVAKFSKEFTEQLSNELGELWERLEASSKQLAEFKREYLQHKMQAVVVEVTETISESEAQVQTLGEVCKLFTSENLDGISTEALKATCEQSAVAEKDASGAINKAKQILNVKQKEAKEAGGAGVHTLSELSKLQGRWNTANAELQKHKKAVGNGERVIRSIQMLTEQPAQKRART